MCMPSSPYVPSDRWQPVLGLPLPHDRDNAGKLYLMCPFLLPLCAQITDGSPCWASPSPMTSPSEELEQLRVQVRAMGLSC